MALAYVSRIMRRRDSLSEAIRRWHGDASIIRLCGHCYRHPKWPLIDDGRGERKAVAPVSGHHPRGAA